jgi:hypothetical protein
MELRMWRLGGCSERTLHQDFAGMAVGWRCSTVKSAEEGDSERKKWSIAGACAGFQPTGDFLPGRWSGTFQTPAAWRSRWTP